MKVSTWSVVELGQANRLQLGREPFAYSLVTLDRGVPPTHPLHLVEVPREKLVDGELRAGVGGRPGLGLQLLDEPLELFGRLAAPAVVAVHHLDHLRPLLPVDSDPEPGPGVVEPLHAAGAMSSLRGHAEILAGG
ncbi:MAG TPA: hypothetical protein VHT49_12655 [Acidimicrobiales bacterium]|nr:hypothetical protein [Acidimicrobiales bacterium]